MNHQREKHTKTNKYLGRLKTRDEINKFIKNELFVCHREPQCDICYKIYDIKDIVNRRDKSKTIEEKNEQIKAFGGMELLRKFMSYDYDNILENHLKMHKKLDEATAHYINLIEDLYYKIGSISSANTQGIIFKKVENRSYHKEYRGLVVDSGTMNYKVKCPYCNGLFKFKQLFLFKNFMSKIKESGWIIKNGVPCDHYLTIKEKLNGIERSLPRQYPESHNNCAIK